MSKSDNIVIIGVHGTLVHAKVCRSAYKMVVVASNDEDMARVGQEFDLSDIKDLDKFIKDNDIEKPRTLDIEKLMPKRALYIEPPKRNFHKPFEDLKQSKRRNRPPKHHRRK